ncbi:MAG: glycosyltransferase [Nitrospirae bacterium]|nr:glycosyltransferase [Nitrospirota bacterium]
MKIKILHILHSLKIGGLENGVVNLVNNLNDERFENVICCIDSSGPMAERFKMPVEIFTLQKGDRRDYLLPFKIAKIIKKIRPDIVHTRNWAAIDGVLGARIAGVKSIIHGEHGRDANDPAGTNNLRKSVRKVLDPWITRFITVSAELRNWLISDIGINEQKVIQIINGVDTGQFKPAEDKHEAKKKLGLSPGLFVIGIVGRLDPVKDHETLFKAFRVFSDNNPERSCLLVIGTGQMDERLKTIVKDLDISKEVIFTGDTDRASEFYRCLDVFVLPSIFEGISNTVLEAMASRLPVITTMVGGSTELVEDSKTGFLLRPGDYKGFAEKIETYFNNPSLVMEHGLLGKARTEKEFSLPVMVGKYEKIYSSLLPRN